MDFPSKLKSYYTTTILPKTLKQHLQDKQRNQDLFIQTPNYCLDLTRQHITPEVLHHFQSHYLSDLKPHISQMRIGSPINSTEKRPVLHYLLRDSEISKINDLSTHFDEVKNCQKQIKIFSEKIRSGEIKGLDGKFENVISIGIGGSYLGVECVYEAVKAHKKSLNFKHNLKLYFLSNVDPSSAAQLIANVNLKKTIVIVVSKTFTTQETLQNLNLMIDAFQHVYPDKVQKDILTHHFCAISANTDKCKEFGIDSERIFPMWDWVGGRFSVSSAVGGLPLSLALSYEVFDEFLHGMHSVDQQFFNQDDIKQNIPVLLGLLDYYHNHVQSFNTKIIIPYAQPLHRFPAHIQQLEMESNGKRHEIINNKLIKTDVGKFVFGEPGTNSQHSFFQLLHQGRVSPVEFIGFSNPQNERHTTNGNDCYNEFIVNMFAQMDALAVGCESSEPSKHFEGGRPSFAILFKNELNAFNCGVLIAIYEHRTAVEGFLENINSFDQFGVELGKKLFKEIRSHLRTKDNQHPVSSNHPCQMLIDYFNKNTHFE